MILVDAIRKCLSDGDMDTVGILAAEYWTPTKEWKFWEYTSPEIVMVVEQLPQPDLVAQSLASLAYSGDSKRLAKLLHTR